MDKDSQVQGVWKDWHVKALHLNLKGSNYYFTQRVFIDKLEIDASKKSELLFDINNFENVTLNADSSVIIRAPLYVWSKLNLSAK